MYNAPMLAFVGKAQWDACWGAGCCWVMMFTCRNQGQAQGSALRAILC